MRDVGYVTKGRHEGKEVIGIRASWEKRYITLAPQATLVGLAVRIIDTRTCWAAARTLALRGAGAYGPSGVEIGRRHCRARCLPERSGLGSRRPSSDRLGDRRREDGRPGLAHADGVPGRRPVDLAAVVLGCRRQVAAAQHVGLRPHPQAVRLPIGKMEGLEEPLARMVENAYVNEAARAVTASMVSRGERPSVLRPS